MAMHQKGVDVVDPTNHLHYTQIIVKRVSSAYLSLSDDRCAIIMPPFEFQFHWLSLQIATRRVNDTIAHCISGGPKFLQITMFYLTFTCFISRFV